jgi:hypothetical protein
MNSGAKHAHYQNEASSYYSSFPVEFYPSSCSNNMNALNTEPYYNLNYSSSGSSTPYQLTSSFQNQSYSNVLNSSNVNINGYNYPSDNYVEDNNNGQNSNFIFNESFPPSQQIPPNLPMETSTNELYEFLPEEIFQLDQPIVKSQNQTSVLEQANSNNYILENSLNLSENAITYSTYNVSPHTVLDLDSSGTIETNTKYLGQTYFNESLSESCCNDSNFIKFKNECKNDRNSQVGNVNSFLIAAHCENSEINNNHSQSSQMLPNNNLFNDGSKTSHIGRDMNCQQEATKKMYNMYENDLNKNIRSQNLDSIQSQIKSYQDKRLQCKKNPLLISCKSEDNYNNHGPMIIQYNGEFSPFRNSHIPSRTCQISKPIQSARSHQSKSISVDSNPQFQNSEHFSASSYIYSKSSLLNDNRIEEKYNSYVQNYMDV